MITRKSKRITWLILNITILIFGFYYGQIVLAYLMVIITFPFGMLVLYFLSLFELFLNYFHIDVINSTNETIILVSQWIIMLISGYIQWFILLPKVIKFFKKKR